MERLTAEDLVMLWPDELWPQEIGCLAVFDGQSLVEPDGRFLIEKVRTAVAGACTWYLGFGRSSPDPAGIGHPAVGGCSSVRPRRSRTSSSTPGSSRRISAAAYGRAISGMPHGSVTTAMGDVAASGPPGKPDRLVDKGPSRYRRRHRRVGDHFSTPGCHARQA